MLTGSYKIFVVIFIGLAFVLNIALFAHLMPKPMWELRVTVSPPDGELHCNGKYKDGAKPSEEEVNHILKKHAQWLIVFPGKQLSNTQEAIQDSRRANLCGADLSGLRKGFLKDVDLTRANLRLTNFAKVDLHGAILEEASIEGTNFSGAVMDFVKLKDAFGVCQGDEWKKRECTNFQEASLNGANISGYFEHANMTGIVANEAKIGAVIHKARLDKAKLTNADLSGSTLIWVDLSHASLENANLNRSHLSNVNFTHTNLSGVNLEGTVLRSVNFSSAKLEPKNVNDTVLIGSEGLSTIDFYDPKRVVKLRNLSKELGLRNEQKALTAALKKFAIQSETPYEAFLQTYVFGGWITNYGADPLRSILMLICLIPLFSVIYYTCLLQNSPSTNIWKVWSTESINSVDCKPGRITEGLGEHREKYFRLLFSAMYFSLLSAFHIGWRDLNVGSWISRLQYEDYVLRATGWIRVISGVQSLISVYLLALWLLTYFGTPFE